MGEPGEMSVVVEPVGTVGRWREGGGGQLSTGSTGWLRGAPAEEDQMAEVVDDVKRWTAKRRAALVLSILRGETSVQEAARKHGLTVAEVEEWKERFLMAAENALRSRPRDDEGLREEQVKRLKQKVGELVLDIDILKEAMRGRPFEERTSGE
jgi:transposase-like protein